MAIPAARATIFATTWVLSTEADLEGLDRKLTDGVLGEKVATPMPRVLSLEHRFRRNRGSNE